MAQADQVSTLFEVLSHPSRRVVLYYLSEHESASIETLAACVAGWAQSGPGVQAMMAPEGYESIRAQLHHTHLPKIAEAGYATYDVENRQMSLGTLPSVADDVLSAAITADTGDGRIDLDALVEAFEEDED